LTPAQRKEFKSCLWAFRTRPENLTEEQAVDLLALFEKLPELKYVYLMRWGVTQVFDTAKNRREAKRRLAEYQAIVDEDDPELQEFFAMYEAHQEGILAYFDARKTSGVVEGINNKARVITKRCYGVKDVQTLWDRLCLDLNLAAQAVGKTIARLAQLTDLIRAKFLGYYT
jgi:transposase